MIKLKKYGIIILLITILLVSFSTNLASADKLTKKISHKKSVLVDQKQKLKANKANYDAIVNKMDDTESKIEELDNQIMESMDKISKTNAKISTAKYDITVAEKAISKTDSSIKQEQDLYYKRLRAMYMNGPTGYLELLLSSKSFIEFLERYQLTKAIMKFDNNLIGNLKHKKQIKVQQKAVLVQKKNNLIKLQNENNANLAQQNKAKNDEKNLITYLQAQKKKYKLAIEQYNEMINTTLKQIAEMKKELEKSNYHYKPGTYSSDALVVYAAHFLGIKYVWGGNTTNGFDCSGFTKYVYGHFGINLNRRAIDQSRQGVRVSKADLKPGDLVFFGNPIHHVGIYVGNGSFIHSPRTGDVIRITALTRRDFAFGTRLR